MMNSLNKAITAMAFFFLLALTSCSGIKQTDVAIHTEEGKSYRFKYEISQDFKVGMFGFGQSVKQELTLQMRIDFGKSEDHLCTIEAIKAEGGDDAHKFSFDSKYPNLKDTSITGILLSQMIGKQYAFTLTPEGALLNVHALYADTAIASYNPVGDSLSWYYTKSMVEDNFGIASLTLDLHQLFGYSAGSPLSTNGMKREFILAKPIPSCYKEKYTFEGEDNGRNKITYSADIKPLSEKAGFEMAGMKMTYDFKGDGNGTYFVSITDKLPLTAKFELKTDGQIGMEGAKGMMGAVKPGMTIRKKIIITRI